MTTRNSLIQISYKSGQVAIRIGLSMDRWLSYLCLCSIQSSSDRRFGSLFNIITSVLQCYGLGFTRDKQSYTDCLLYKSGLPLDVQECIFTLTCVGI